MDMSGSNIRLFAFISKNAIGSIALLLSLVCLTLISCNSNAIPFLKKNKIVKILNDNRDFSGMDLSHVDLYGTGIRMRNSNFEGADLSGSNLTRINVRNSNLKGANLSGAVLIKTEFDDSDLSGADLSRADLTRACLCPSNLTGANLEGATLRRADFFKALLRGANFRNADLSGANFEGADIDGADFTGANLEGVRHMDETHNRDRAIGLK